MTNFATKTDRLPYLTAVVCDKIASQDDLVELDALLFSDKNARRRYLDYCQLHFTLALELRANWLVQKVHQQGNLTPELPIPDPSSAAMIVIPLTVPSPAPIPTLLSTTFGYFSSGWPMAYLVATMILGIGLVIGAITHVSYSVQVVKQLPADTKGQPTPVPRTQPVGRVTGMADCEFSDPSTLTYIGAYVSIGRKYALSSGLLEITYDTGAKVILQGPVAYEVESKNGGFLPAGKLTGKVEVAEARGFSVRTPTATVTDLGTEFGVEVRGINATKVFVFQGQVNVVSQLAADAGGCDNVRTQQRLVAGEAVRVDSSGKIVTDANSTGKSFASLRSLPASKTRTISNLLLHDTFKNAADSEAYSFAGDWGLNREREARQTGRLAPAWYCRGGVFFENAVTFAQVHHNAGHPDGLCLFSEHGSSGWLVMDRNFPPDIELSVVVDPVAFRYGLHGKTPSFTEGDTTSSNWVALSVRGKGTSPASSVLPEASNAGAVLLIRSQGGWSYWENGVLIAKGSVPAVDRYTVRMRSVGNRLDIFVNDVALDLDSEGSATARTMHGMAADPSHNFVGIGICNADSPPDLNGRQVSVLYDLQVTAVESSN